LLPSAPASQSRPVLPLIPVGVTIRSVLGRIGSV
jgi:hypothetical protein